MTMKSEQVKGLQQFLNNVELTEVKLTAKVEHEGDVAEVSVDLDEEGVEFIRDLIMDAEGRMIAPCPHCRSKRSSIVTGKHLLRVLL